MSGTPRTWLVRERATLCGAAFVGAIAVWLCLSGFKELQADSFRLLYAGRYIAQHGLPHQEVFTLAGRGRPFADQQWLAELTDYEAWRLAGYGGLAVLAALTFGSGYALLTALLRRRGASLPIAISCALLASFSALTLTFVRAQLFALPLFVALLWLCLGDADGERLRGRTVLVLPLIALWANVHGSVVIGAALAFAYFAYRATTMALRRSRRQAVAYSSLAAIVVLMPLVTPYGAHILAYYQGMFGNHAVRLADIEWDPPAFGALSFFQFVIPLALAATCAVVAAMRGRRPSWPLLGAIVITGTAAALTMRSNVWLGIAAAALIAESARDWIPSRAPDPRFVALLAAAAAVLAVVGIGRLAARSAEGFLSHAPLRAVTASATYADSHPCARVLADNASASALLWLDPALAGRVGFDGELEAYSQPALIRWVEYQSGSGHDWTAATDGYQILLGTTADHPDLVKRLTQLPGARVLASDTTGVGVADGGCGEVTRG